MEETDYPLAGATLLVKLATGAKHNERAYYSPVLCGSSRGIPYINTVPSYIVLPLCTRQPTTLHALELCPRGISS